MSSIELWPKQQEVFNFACEKPQVALLCEQRTGKTFITMKLMEHRIKRLDQEGLEFVGLHVCLLNNLESTWIHNLRAHIGQLQIFRELSEFRRAKGHRILILNFEALAGTIGKLCKYKKINWASVDEAHRLYNRGSRQSRAMARMSWVQWKLILTGTPMEQKPTDFFAQFSFLAPDVFGKRHSDFELKWLSWKKLDLGDFKGMRPGGPAWKQKVLQQRILKSKAKFRDELLPEFIDLLKPYCIRIDKSDVGITQARIVHHDIDMPPRHRIRYELMKDQSWVGLPDGSEVLATLPVTRVMKLRQLASGLIHDENADLHWLSTFKIRAAIGLFEDLPKPVVIFSNFTAEVDAVFEALKRGGYDVDRVYGRTPKKDRPATWKAFQRGQLDAVVCQTTAGGVGVDLWKSNHAIITSMSYSSIVWDQAISRLDSRDKKVPGTIHLIRARGTIDEDLCDLIVKKGEATSDVLKTLKGRYKCPRKPPTKKHPRARRCRSTT